MSFFDTLTAFIAGLGATALCAEWVSNRNRRLELDRNKEPPDFTHREMNWQIVHMRDDLSMVVTALAITNGLLAAIVALLFSR